MKRSVKKWAKDGKIRSARWVELKLNGELTIDDEIREIRWLNEIEKLRNKTEE